MGNSEIPSFYEFIKQKLPDYDNNSLSSEELNHFRKDYIEQLLQEELGELTEVEKTVARSITDKKIFAGSLLQKENEKLSAGEKMADKVASFGGSWTFITIFFSFLTGWMILNVWWLNNKGYDPYPFILLNLILSCLAAIQAPIIMMSQNRQEAKDRNRAEHDYTVNLKAEVEIRMLHEKIDHLLLHQNKRLLEIQKVQVDMMAGISRMIKEQTRQQ